VNVGFGSGFADMHVKRLVTERSTIQIWRYIMSICRILGENVMNRSLI